MKKPDADEVLDYFASVKPRKEDRGAFWMGVVFVLLALSVPAYQALLWLQTATWSPPHYVGD